MQSLFFSVSEKDRTLPVYLTSVGHRPQIPIERPEGFPDFHWLHTIDGEGVVELQGETRILRNGQGFLMVPDVPHRYWPLGTWNVMWFTFHGTHIDEFMSAWGLQTGFIDLTDVRILSSLINDMLIVGLEHSPLQSSALSTLVYRFLHELLRQSSLRHEVRQGQEKLQPILDYIAQHLDTPLSLSELAEMLEVTPQHLCRLFQSSLGTTPLNYITALRISRAKSLLIDEPQMPIAEVARRVGFPNHSYFCSVFKQRERRTPSEFRTLRLGIPFPPQGVEIRLVRDR